MLQSRMKNNLRLSKNNQGVTLVEVISVIAIMSVVMAAVAGFMITGAKMSAQVSGGATASMREQTATEFINQRLWECQAPITTDGESQQIEYNGQQIDVYPILKIGDKILTTTSPEDSNQVKVTYNNVELCNGDIYFGNFENDTVIYYLNGTKHVVRVRIASGQP